MKKKQIGITLTAIALLASVPAGIHAITWSGAGDGTNWNDAANWSGGVKPEVYDTAALYWASKPADTTIAIGAPQAFSRLSFEGSVPNNLYVGTSADVLAGNTLSLSSVFRSTTLSNNQYVDADVILPAISIWDINNGYNGVLTIRGSISGASGEFIKNGNGTLTLNGDNPISGDFHVNNGTLAMGHTNALGSTGTIYLNGGTLGIYGPKDISPRLSPSTHYYSLDTVGTSVSFATPLTGDDAQLVKRGAGTLTLTVPNAYTGPTTIAGGTLTFSDSGSLGSTTAPLTMTGGSSSILDIASASPLTVGDVLFYNPSSHAGTIQNGTLIGTDFLSYFTGSSYVDAVLAGTGAELVKGSSGTLYLRKSNTYTGDTIVNAGVLRLDFNNASAAISNMIHQTSRLVMGGGTLHLYNHFNTLGNRYQKLDALRVENGASKFTLDMNASRSTRLEFSALSRTNGATLNIVQPTGNTAINANNGYVSGTDVDATGLLGAGYLTVNGADWATNNGVNVVAYTGYNTVAGEAAVIPDSATANVQINGATTDTVTLASSMTTVNTLKSADPLARTVDLGGGTLRLGVVGGILTQNTSGTLSINNGTLTAGGAANTAGEVVFHNAQAVNSAADIADNGTGPVSLVKSGDGTLTLIGQKTYTGGTFMNAGTLQLPAGTSPLSTGGDITVSGGTLNLGTAAQTTTGKVTMRGGTLSNGTLTLDGANLAAEGGTISAKLVGSAGLDKTTYETLALSNTSANTFTGTTTITRGIVTAGNVADVVSISGPLVVGSPEGGPSATFRNLNNRKGFATNKPVTVHGNGTVDFGGGAQNLNGGAVTILGGSLTGSQLYIYSASPVYMTGGTFSGNCYGGSYTIHSHTNAETAVVAANQNHSVTYNVADGAAPVDLAYTGGAGGTDRTLTKNGAGLMTLTGSSSYGGGTTINAGTVLVDNTFGSGTGAGVVTVKAGTTLGGTGFIGGVAGYTTANVTATGTSGNPAIVSPGTVDPTTGDHVIGALTIGSTFQTNNVTFGTYSTLKINFDSEGNCDKLVVDGTLSLNATTDKLELSIDDYDALKPGTYTLATFNQLATLGSVFDLLDIPSRGTLVYTPTSIDYIVASKTTLILVK